DAEHVGAARLLAHEPAKRLAHPAAQLHAAEVDELGDAVDLQQQATERKTVAPRPRELGLHQVQDLRLREHRAADEALVGLARTALAPTRPSLAETRFAHLPAMIVRPIGATIPGGPARKKSRASAGQN